MMRDLNNRLLPLSRLERLVVKLLAFIHFTDRKVWRNIFLRLGTVSFIFWASHFKLFRIKWHHHIYIFPTCKCNAHNVHPCIFVLSCSSTYLKSFNFTIDFVIFITHSPHTRPINKDHAHTPTDSQPGRCCVSRFKSNSTLLNWTIVRRFVFHHKKKSSSVLKGGHVLVALERMSSSFTIFLYTFCDQFL